MDSIIVAPPLLRLPTGAVPSGDAPSAQAETNLLLRQLLEAQREQITLLRTQLARHDDAERHRRLTERHGKQFELLPFACHAALPKLERRYLELLTDLTERLDSDEADLDSDYGLSDFLDRYGPRLMQLGNIVNQVGHLAQPPAPKPDRTAE